MSFLFLKTQTAKKQSIGYWTGLVASVPIVLGYLPVAMAFGLAAKGAGFAPFEATLISALIFAGASQFVLVSMVATGTPILFAALICLALNIRHLIYGPSLATKLKADRDKRLAIISFGITDEVFSTSLSQLGNIDKQYQMNWLMGLEAGAYFTWVTATWVGAYLGDIAIKYLPVIEPAFSFALPALFLTLVMPMIRKDTILIVIGVALISIILIHSGLGAYATLTAAILGPVIWLITRGKGWNH
jgi:4-azaleucine resistance transporter AzlC